MFLKAVRRLDETSASSDDQGSIGRRGRRSFYRRVLSIRGGSLRMIDDEHFDGALGWLELQTELLHGGEND